MHKALIGSGYRLLEPDEKLLFGDETVCRSTLEAEMEEWTAVHSDVLGQSVETALENDADAGERLFRRSTKLNVAPLAEAYVQATDAAHIAYEAYSKTTNNKNFRGEEMPAFNDLPPKIQEAWTNAAHAAGLHAIEEQEKGNARKAYREFGPSQ